MIKTRGLLQSFVYSWTWLHIAKCSSPLNILLTIFRRFKTHTHSFSLVTSRSKIKWKCAYNITNITYIKNSDDTNSNALMFVARVHLILRNWSLKAPCWEDTRKKRLYHLHKAVTLLNFGTDYFYRTSTVEIRATWYHSLEGGRGSLFRNYVRFVILVRFLHLFVPISVNFTEPLRRNNSLVTLTFYS